MITRRTLLKTAAVTTLAYAGVSALTESLADPTPAPAPEPTGPFTLPKLPYAYDALEPAIDAKTMTIHHDKHHAAYVKNANKALVDHPELAKKSAEDIVKNLNDVPEAIRTTLRNNVGGHLNHSWFWVWMTPGAKPEPTGDLAAAITKDFGSFAGFKEKFTVAAMKVFGSGWAWLSVDSKGNLLIETTPNQDNPLMAGSNKPILGVDVWEHAYYLKHQNLRAGYLEDFFTVINWDEVGKGLKS
jgi:Fe-Mn family superoxide dismutase